MSATDGIFSGVHPDWLEIIDREKFMEELSPLMENITPEPDLILEAFRYCSPSQVKVVIMGQDPYPHGAQGLSFSIAHGAPLRPSLERIFRCLENFNLKTSSGEESGDLRSWAIQGVLLLNSSLTNVKGSTNAHKGHWQKLVQKIVGSLTESLPHFLLWGANAAKIEKYIPRGCEVFKWSHPSPLADNRLPAERKFCNCPHFVNLPYDIVWDNKAPLIIFTDGACVNNGCSNARAAFAVYIASGVLKNTYFSGMVEPYEYEFIDPENPIMGFVPKPQNMLEMSEARSGDRRCRSLIAPTNNRGEYLAGCWALLFALRGFSHGIIDIVSDSRLFIQTLTEWLPNRRKKGTENELKNLDLILIAECLFKKLREQCEKVKLIHTNSHQPRPKKSATPMEKIIWHGNNEADILATSAIEESPMDGQVSAGEGSSSSTGEVPRHFKLDNPSESIKWTLLYRYC